MPAQGLQGEGGKHIPYLQSQLLRQPAPDLQGAENLSQASVPLQPGVIPALRFPETPGFLHRHGGDLENPPPDIQKHHVQGDPGVLHPEDLGTGRQGEESHGRRVGQVGPPLQSLRLLLGGAGQFHHFKALGANLHVPQNLPRNSRDGAPEAEKKENKHCFSHNRGTITDFMPTTFSIKTYGCQMNERDSEALACLLEMNGFQEVQEDEDPDVMIFNTCSVRDQAERKVLGKVGLMKRRKRERPDLVLGIIGCMAQRRGESLLQELPHLDFVAGTDQLQNIPALVKDCLAKKGQGCAIDMGPGVFRELDGHRPGRLVAEVSVMRGCDQFCTYCIVPFCRGREKSRPIGDIVAEARMLAETGTKELLLLGQNITAYGVAEARARGEYTPEFSGFADLLEALQEVPGIQRIRFTSPHVRFMNRRFVEAVSTLPKVCPSFHVPLQSGSDRILKLMHRNYTAAEYLERIQAIRERLPQATFSTDIIVGFCSETEEEFEMTRQMMQTVGYDMAYIFRYSQREGTQAARTLPDDVPEEEKHRRNQILLEELARHVKAANAAAVGTTAQVLVEGPSARNPQRWSGRSLTNKMVLFSPQENLHAGDVADFRIVRATENALYGELCR